jgi:hypothetical protein
VQTLPLLFWEHGGWLGSCQPLSLAMSVGSGCWQGLCFQVLRTAQAKRPSSLGCTATTGQGAWRLR